MGTIAGSGVPVSGLGGSAGYGETALDRGDDIFAQADVSAVFQQGFILDGVTYDPTQFYISTDGFVTFGAGVSAMPADPSTLAVPFFAIFMADVDTRLDGEPPESGQIWLDVDAANDVVTITWDQVGFYRRDAAKTNTFQMQLFDRGSGQVDVVYRFGAVEWTSGDLQGGFDGLGGTPAFVGYRAGAFGPVLSLPGSRDESALLALPGTAGNTGTTGLFAFRILPQTLAQAGSSASDLLQGSVAADVMQALAGDDIIFASGGADTIDGGAGFDLLDFSHATAGLVLDLVTAGNSTGWASGLSLAGIEGYRGSPYADQFFGGSGLDWMQGGDGGDAMTGNGGADLLMGEAGADTIYGGAGADRLIGGDGNDLLQGGGEDDTLNGGAGADTLQGGDGIDTADYSGAPDAVRVDLTNAASNLGWAAGDILSAIERLIGGTGNDTLIGTALAETLWGGDGGDDLHAGDGANLVYGGAGKDAIVAGGGADTLYGGGGNDTLSGGDGANLLVGDQGNDVIRPGSGADTIDGGAGTDKLDYSAAQSAVILDLANPANTAGWALGDVLSGIEIIRASHFGDRITGSTAAEVLYGLDGNDTLLGQGGADTIRGGLGDDSINGGDGADSLSGGDGQDIVMGGAGNDQMEGRAGNDLILGEAGADLMSGGPGSDTMTGGADADVFRASGDSGDGADLITDYSAAEQDVLLLDLPGVTRSDLSITYATMAGLGADTLAEAVITYLPTGEVLWILQDGAAQVDGFWFQSSSSSTTGAFLIL